MRNRTLEVKTVSRLEPVFLAIQCNCKLAAQEVEKLFALVRVRVAALRRRRHTKYMGLHHRVAPCQQLDKHSSLSLQNLSGVRTHLQAAGICPIKEIKNISFVKARQLAQRSDRSAHLRPLQSAQKSHRYTPRARHLCQRQFPFHPQLPQMPADRPRVAVWHGL